MNVLRASRVAALLFCTTAAQADPLAEAVAGVVEATEPSVVQLRYFGAGGESLGAAGAPVTGYDLGDGWVLTSLYGLGDGVEGVLCLTPDGAQQTAQVVGRDESRRLALLRLAGAGSDAPPRIDGRDARLGETVVAFGRVYDRQSTTTTVGIVSATGRLGGRAVQTDALVSPTNYGGPLVALDGRVVGLLTPLAGPGMRGVDLYDSGIGFAVTTAQINARLAAMAAGETVRQGWLGASFPREDPLRSPARIESLAEGGPAAEAGLAEGDVLLALDGHDVPTCWALRAVLSGLDAGATVQVDYQRDGERRPVDAVLGDRPAREQPPVPELEIGAEKNPDEP
ncbi:trypsin-like peptidase domain-containing protein [Botrimarina sp.]|uniref:S1C family serine protease n=1 Tax=Botrimarina sp. TaxID=2795802 RepID=UPI0032EC9F4D